MSWENVLLHVKGNVAFITLNRPERMNADWRQDAPGAR